MRVWSRRAALAGVGLLWMGVSSSVLAQEEAQLVLEVSAAGEERAGGERLGQMRHGQLRAGQSSRFSGRIPAGRCLLLVAQGAASIRDLDVFIRRGRSVLAQDHTATHSANARHCAGGQALRVQLAVRAFQGAGPFAAAAYLIDENAPALNEAAGETPLQRLEALSAEHTEGYTPVTPPHRDELTSDARLEREVRLEPGRCYRILAAAGQSIANLRLSISDDNGTVLQEAGTSHRTPTLGVLRPLCPATAGSYTVRLQSSPDSGTVAWRAFGATSGSSRRSQQAQRTFPVGGQGNGYIASAIRRRHSQVGEGRAAIIERVENRHQRSEVKDVEVAVLAGHCYVAIAAGQPSARQVSLQIVDQYGQERGSAAATRTPNARFCAPIAGTYKIRVKVDLGYGIVGVQAFGGPR